MSRNLFFWIVLAGCVQASFKPLTLLTQVTELQGHYCLQKLEPELLWTFSYNDWCGLCHMERDFICYLLPNSFCCFWVLIPKSLYHWIKLELHYQVPNLECLWFWTASASSRMLYGRQFAMLFTAIFFLSFYVPSQLKDGSIIFWLTLEQSFPENRMCVSNLASHQILSMPFRNPIKESTNCD